MTDQEFLRKITEYFGLAPVHRQVFNSEVVDLMRWAYEEGYSDGWIARVE